MSVPHDESDLSRIYARRFAANLDYRKRVWRVLIDSFFQDYVPLDGAVLDLGCGYGDFINQIQAARKFAMDLNPDAPRHLSTDVKFIQQDCSLAWPVDEASLDVVFTSNFFEHLPDKASLGRTLDNAHRSLRKGGLLIAMGPNVRLVPGAYWDFWDHYIALTESSLGEALENRGFRIERKERAFLPYTMAGKKPAPLPLVKLYLVLPWLWRFFGKQFLVISAKV